MKLLAIAASVGLAIGVLIAGTGTSLYYKNQIKGIKLDLKDEAITSLQQQIVDRDAAVKKANERIAKLESFNATKNKELQDVLDKNRDIADRIASGELVPRVRIKPQSCPAASGVQDPSTGSMGDEAYAELNPTARQDFLNLRAGIIQVEGQVSYLQGYITQFCE